MILNYQLDRNLEENYIKFYYLLDYLDDKVIPGWSVSEQFLCYSPENIESLKNFELTFSDALDLVLNQDPEAYIDKWGFISSRIPDFWGE